MYTGYVTCIHIWLKTSKKMTSKNFMVLYVPPSRMVAITKILYVTRSLQLSSNNTSIILQLQNHLPNIGVPSVLAYFNLYMAFCKINILVMFFSPKNKLFQPSSCHQLSMLNTEKLINFCFSNYPFLGFLFQETEFS